VIAFHPWMAYQSGGAGCRKIAGICPELVLFDVCMAGSGGALPMIDVLKAAGKTK
jgi:hypothetical protein